MSNKANSYAQEVESALEDLSSKVTESRFPLKEKTGKPVQIGVIAGVAGGIVGALSMYLREDVHPVAAVSGAAAGCAVGYAVGKLLYPIELIGDTPGKILAGAGGFFNGVGIAAGTADLINGFITPTVSDADL